MTNSEANNPSSAPQPSSVVAERWSWLADRLPSEGREKLGHWLVAELDELENAMQHMVSPNSLQRSFRSGRRSSTEP